MNKVNKKLKNLIKNFDFKKEELGEITKMYSGQPFNHEDAAYKKLLQESSVLCQKYTQLCNQEQAARRKNKKLNMSVFKFIWFYFKKAHILKLLFPVHGFVLYAESGIDAVIGLVDLKGYGFINKNVKFTKNSLVDVKKSNIFALDLQIGSLEEQDKLTQIVIDKNCWICAGAKIYANVGHDSVVAAGGFLQDDLAPNMLAVGRPCKAIKSVNEPKNHNKLFKFNDSQLKIISEHIKKINFGKFPKEFEKAICGEEFDTMDKTLSYLYRLTRCLCNEYNTCDIDQKRKEEILDILFVNHGKNLKVGKGIHIDLIGTVLIGEDVKIGENVSLGGNIIIEDGAEIGNNSILFASGHSLIAKERKAKFSLRKGMYENAEYDFIKVRKNVKIANNVVIVPNSDVLENVAEGMLYVKGKQIK